MIRLLIVEDSITQREILRRLLDGDPEFAVLAEARDGREALEFVEKYAPDVVLMDIHMPEMDGIAATREIMKRHPVPIVVASATLKKRDVDLAMKALEAGAVSVIEKPEGAVLLHLHKIGPELRRELIAASKARVGRAFPLNRAAAVAAGTSANRRPAGPIKAVGICASTGGPPVLVTILSAITKPFPIPILLVQHISPGFEEGFARWLSESTGQPVRLAVHGQRLEPGIWLAPTGRHLTLSAGDRIDLVGAAPSDIHTPSGNPLFASLAAQLGTRAGGVLLTGMGDDGAEGLLSLRKAGGSTVIQSEASCLIWGMPKAARERDAAEQELHPDQIASYLAKMVSHG